jgi:hypothetical protein
MMAPHIKKAKLPIDGPNHWRVRANEVRAIGEQMQRQVVQ